MTPGDGRQPPPLGRWPGRRVEQALSSIGAVLIVAGYVVKVWWGFVPANVVVGNVVTLLGAAVVLLSLARSLLRRRR